MPNFPAKPNLDALEYALPRTILPNTLSAAELAQLPADLRQAAVFSAGVTQAELLQLIHERVAQITGGVAKEDGRTPDISTTRQEIKGLLREIGYEPDAKDIATIKDLRTNARINLILETQTAMTHGWGASRRAFTPAIRLAYPAWEFKRVFSRRVPRGWQRKKGIVLPENPRYWQDRWQQAGGVLHHGRMIAVIDDPVWIALSRFGLNQDPVDYNTGFRRKVVGAAEALRLGVVTREDLAQLRQAAKPGSGERGAGSAESANQPAQPELRATDPGRLIDSFQASAASFFPALRLALVKTLRGLFTLNSDGVLVPAAEVVP